jgi:hypothetical protein
MSRIYLSSTFTDLETARAAVTKTLRRAGHDVVEMEEYVAADERPLDRCLADVASCDVYVGIIAWRYGYVPPGQTNSITELEFREARRLKKPTLLFLLHEDAPWPRSMVDRDETSVERLRAELGRDCLVSFFRSADDLAALVSAAVAKSERSSAARAQRADFLRTPVLGLEVWQGGTRRPLLRASAGAIRVTMIQEPFEFRIPGVTAEDHVKITANFDDAMFKYVETTTERDRIPFFAGGTGMADTNFGSGELFLCDDGHMYLDWSSRLAPQDGGGGATVLFHSIRLISDGSSEVVALPRDRNVYTIVHLARPSTTSAGPYDSERLILSF